ncbi:MAG: hypothetical protein HYU60_03390 [Magnetospirillum sp.]|nr:hypothetical protein [Magnetospirillum sp.]
MTVGTLATVDGPTAVRRVNDTLQGPVVDILCQFLPELRSLTRREAYESALNDLGLLERCFKVFREERRGFRFVTVDERHRPVTDENGMLSCGRTLAEVIAMVIRTAAKRYFRRKATAADELYDAIQDYLLHDWQVPLVPAYAEMSPSLVRSLGARLLEFREPEALIRLTVDSSAGRAAAASAQAAADPPAAAAAPSEPARPAAELGVILSADHKRLVPAAFTATLLEPDVRAVLKQPEQVLRSTDVLRGVGGEVTATLVVGLGLSKAQLVVFLLISHECIGAEVFGRIFGIPGRPHLVARIVEHAQRAGIGRDAGLPACATFVRTLFARFKGMGQL